MPPSAGWRNRKPTLSWHGPLGQASTRSEERWLAAGFKRSRVLPQAKSSCVSSRTPGFPPGLLPGTTLLFRARLFYRLSNTNNLALPAGQDPLLAACSSFHVLPDILD